MNAQLKDIIKNDLKIEETKNISKELKPFSKDETLEFESNDFHLIFNKSSKKMKITTKTKISFDIETDRDINIKCRSFNLLAEDDICIDSIKNLFLNSKMAKQIRDLPESIEYRLASLEDELLSIAENNEFSKEDLVKYIKMRKETLCLGE